MAAREERWAAYFYPETYDPVTRTGTLRNLLNERDRDVLSALEHGATLRRQRQLMSADVMVPRTYDAAHVQAIHGYLFQDVYDWAGEFRTVNLFKGTPRGFADVETGEIDRCLRDMHRLVAATVWARLDRDRFVDRAAAVFAYLNQAHPFREGNGRTSKVFMEHVAERSRFTLDFARVGPDEWNEASRLSGPDLFAYEPQPASLVPVFRAIAVERSMRDSPDAAPR